MAVGKGVCCKIRAMPLKEANDAPSLGFFFEQWVGLILSSGQDAIKGMGFELVYYKGKERDLSGLGWPKASRTLYADEDFMFDCILRTAGDAIRQAEDEEMVEMAGTQRKTYQKPL